MVILVLLQVVMVVVAVVAVVGASLLWLRGGVFRFLV